MWTADDEIESISRSMDAIFSGTFNMVDRLFDLQERSLRPLFRIQVNDEVRVTVDLPGVKQENLKVTCTEQALTVEAKMSKPVRLRVGGAYQQVEEFERYSATISLPVRVDPKKAKAKINNGRLLVSAPLLSVPRSIKLRALPKKAEKKGRARPRKRVS